MPELPEIEHLRRTLEPLLVGSAVRSVRLHRADVVHWQRGGREGQLLRGATIAALHRHGKQLAVEAVDGRVLCFHLGMSGQLYVVRRDKVGVDGDDHVHCVWGLADGCGDRVRPGTRAGRSEDGQLCFRDPRRFGGIWVFESRADLLRHRWATLGPDALDVPLAALADRLAGMRRAVKSALLDQRVIAGVGNIYADESLFHAGIHPLSMASLLPPTAVERLAEAVRATLDAAIRAGGSTVRDYVDGTGRSGAYAAEHLVYGRAGEPCRRCGATLRAVRLAQRTTVFCAQCQKRFIARRPGSRSQATASGAPGRRGRTSAAHH